MMSDVNKAPEAVGPENLPDLKAHVEVLLAEARAQGADACEALALRTAHRVQRVADDHVDPCTPTLQLGLGWQSTLVSARLR